MALICSAAGAAVRVPVIATPPPPAYRQILAPTQAAVGLVFLCEKIQIV